MSSNISTFIDSVVAITRAAFRYLITVKSCLRLRGKSSSVRLPYAGVRASLSRFKKSKSSLLVHTRSESRFSTQASCYIRPSSKILHLLLQGICHTDEYTRSGADPEVWIESSRGSRSTTRLLVAGRFPSYSWARRRRDRAHPFFPSGSIRFSPITPIRCLGRVRGRRRNQCESRACASEVPSQLSHSRMVSSYRGTM